jgi:hypothetical protein
MRYGKTYTTALNFSSSSLCMCARARSFPTNNIAVEWKMLLLLLSPPSSVVNFPSARHTHFFLSRPLFRLVFFSFFYRCRACLAFHNVCRNAIKLENMLLQFSILFVLLFLFSVVDDRHVMVNSLSFLFCYFYYDVT